MDHHIKEFYCQFSEMTPHGTFHSVIPLHEHSILKWEEVRSRIPFFCKGWYELMHLSSRDRIEFSRDFWRSQLPYHRDLDDFLFRFFNGLDDIGVFLTQKKYDDPYQAYLVYSLKGDRGFFSGRLPASSVELEALQKQFPSLIFPEDYLKFLQIHNGFSKTTDSTGIIPSDSLYESYLAFQNTIGKEEPILAPHGRTVDPASLIPFYESFGMPFFQCFWKEWYPEQEMGNVYYSGATRSISDIQVGIGSDTMAFPTFIDWLIFYLESVD